MYNKKRSDVERASMKKTLRVLALTGILTMACSFNAMAGWEQTGTQGSTKTTYRAHI